ncbi:amino acid oxidase [Pseudomonas sp. ATCC 13867]|nr:amino acid oxidase [Pseudomonas sp. ATCC 13867]
MGVGPSRLSLALGRQDQWSGCTPVVRRCKTFPSELLRFIGGSLVRKAYLILG